MVNTTSVQYWQRTTICVCLSSKQESGGDQFEYRRARIARELWAGGGRVACWWGAPPDAYDAVGCSVLLVCDSVDVLVSCWEGSRFREYKVPSSKIIEFVKQKLSPDSARTPEYSNRSTNWSESDKSSGPTISVTFITASERITKSIKRQCEAQINNQITSMLVNLGLQTAMSRVRVHVAALACEAPCVRLLAAHLAAPLDAQGLPHAFRPVVEMYTKRQNILELALREMTVIAKQSNQSKSSEEIQLFALYSIPDSLCRIIT
ncbi:unnamed protein product [Euphydryas editha]|uniref:Uncharacterized protein n=1 Tax=Euphydryas editha TaxID=104508 RepID=A0AAU9UDB2_EUPED|nr:unnamed protein product [Euphydryas editha]